MMVDIKADQEFTKQVTLQELKANPKLLNMMVTRKGMRLSVQPVTAEEWAEVLSMGGLSSHPTGFTQPGPLTYQLTYPVR